MSSISAWQTLGAFVSEGRNVGEDKLGKFQSVGGKWIVLLVDQLGRANGDGVRWNHDHFDDFKKKCAPFGIKVGSWFNGWGQPANIDAKIIADFVHAHDAGPVMLDLEGDYKSDPSIFPSLLATVRLLLPGRAIGCTTPGQFDNALIWNGRTLNPAQSFWDLGIRWCPQWYSSYYSKDGHTDPVYCMQQLADNGATDYNYRDATAPGRRGLPSSYCKGVLEVTGLESSFLSDELIRVKQAKSMGLLPSRGLSIYLLENLSDPNDWALLAAERGNLFL